MSEPATVTFEENLVSLLDEVVTLWQPIPVSVGEDGTEATISLPERNLLIVGEPGGGKSVALQQIIAAAALDPAVHLTLFDANRVQLSVWRGCADRFIGPRRPRGHLRPGGTPGWHERAL